MKKLILIDGNAIMHRAYHAIPPFKTSQGTLVNAVYGFSSMLLNILNKEKPDFIAVSFDLKGPTFRHEEYADYKATRVKAPDDFYEQIPMIRRVVESFGIPIYEKEGFEADDVLGTLSAQAEKIDDVYTYIVTGDMDALQLVSEKTFVYTPVKGIAETITYDLPKVLAKYGLTAEQIPDLKGLKGDSSDNIKGVNGIGEKTAVTLLQKYGTIDHIYRHIDEIEGKLKEKLVAGKDSAFQSLHLATIVRDVPVSLDIDACVTQTYDKEKIISLFQEFEFKSLISKLTTFNNHSDTARAENSVAQQTLF
jgi:DNA polymerase-1